MGTIRVVVLLMAGALAGCKAPGAAERDAGPPIPMALDIDATKTLDTPLRVGHPPRGDAQ